MPFRLKSTLVKKFYLPQITCTVDILIILAQAFVNLYRKCAGKVPSMRCKMSKGCVIKPQQEIGNAL